jgi:prepilin-type N-terminal cleavage/methylation domain-containing protein
MSHTKATGTRKGFTLVELAVVIVIIGVLAAFGVPRFLKSVERSKASESFAFLSAVRGAQERYIAKEGFYATQLGNLDINQSSLKYFKDKTGKADVTPTTAITTTVFNPAAKSSDPNGTAGQPTWILTLVRDVTTSSYGNYTVVFTEEGFDSASTILDTTTGCSDISPLPSSAATSSGITDGS